MVTLKSVRVIATGIALGFGIAGCGVNLGTMPGSSKESASARLVPQVRAIAQPPKPKTWEEKLLLSFDSKNGQYPTSSLEIDQINNLLGTTSYGGANNVGTVFKLTPTGSGYTFTLIYSFLDKKTDGQYPNAYPISDKLGNLFTTTTAGGTSGGGTAVELTPAGKGYNEKILVNFSNLQPYSPILLPITHGPQRLFGTSLGGGTKNLGTAYELTPSGSGYTQTVLHNFAGGSSDGSDPYAGLVTGKNGVLFGTTIKGGPTDQGTVFKLTPSGSSYTESIVYSFAGGSSDGAYPYAGLIIDKKGGLYGTTINGGSANNGVVFKLTPSGSGFKESVLHGFGSNNNGQYPYGGLIFGSKGTIFGTTENGGTAGLGTVFQLTPSGNNYTESVIYNFLGGTNDGQFPEGGLISVKGALYGMTYGGGTKNYGTIFELK